jgi:Ser/Thr protein kinase RdoA (MazF antagonist)
MRLYRGQMRALDFDDCAYGHPVNDVGITLFYIWAHPQYAELRAAYRRGYESRLPWPEDMPGDIEAIFAAREILLMDTLQYENNPQYKKTLPGFVARAEQRLRAYLDGKIFPARIITN